jgi:hypothetical protein
MSLAILFDDVEVNRVRIRQAFNPDESTTLLDFDASEELPRGNSYERHIEKQVAKLDSESPIGLVACDKELGEYENYRGLSANTVSAVARNLGIPFCQYSRNFDSHQELARYDKLRRWNSDEITLEGTDQEDWGSQIREFLGGFESIRDAYQDESLHRLKPAKALATIMGRRESATKLGLYGEGDQSVMTEIFAFLSTDRDSTKLAHRMPRILGAWLWLSILRFPGLLVDEVAAASLLNIDTTKFSEAKIKSKFADAAYTGPFCTLGDWWWREDLEGMVLDSGASDGRRYLSTLGIDVPPCLDSQTGEAAGYYCMINKAPVSFANSVGDISWFPPGADLARIQIDKYQEITSLISI